MAESSSTKGEFNAKDLSPIGGGPSHPRGKRRYSNDDIDVHYTSLTQVQFSSPMDLSPSVGAMALTPTDPPQSAGLLALTPSESMHEAGAAALTPTEPWQGGAEMGLTPPRRQSAASVQTEVPLRSPKAPGSRRRSEAANHDGKRRKSRGNGETIAVLDPSALQDPAAANGVRRGTRGSQMMSPYDVDATRTSVSSGVRRKTSRHSEAQEEDLDERRRNKVVFICASVAVTIFLLAILLVAITLRMSPAIDEMGECSSGPVSFVT